MAGPHPLNATHRVHKRKPTSSSAARARKAAAAAARVEVGETSGTPFVVYSEAAVMQSNLDLRRARNGQAPASLQVSAGPANPNNAQMDSTGQAPAFEVASREVEVTDRIAQAMHLLTLEQQATTTTTTTGPCPLPLPTTAELETYQNPQAGLNEAIQTALGALHKIMIAREMLKSAGLQTPMYADDGMTTEAGNEDKEEEEEASASLMYGQTGSGRAVDSAYKRAGEGVASAMTQLVWVKQWLDDERSKVLATIVRHGRGF